MADLFSQAEQDIVRRFLQKASPKYALEHGFKDVLTAFLGRAEADDWVKLGLKRSKSQRTNERAAPNEHEQYFRSALKQKSISEPGLTDRAYQLRQAFEVLVVATNQFTEKTAEWRDAFWDHGRKAIFTRESIKSIEKSVQVLWNGMCRASEGTEVCALQESFVLVVLAEVQHYLNDHDFYLGPRSKGQRVDSSVIDWMAKTIWGSEYSAHRERLRSKLREGRTRMQVQKTLGLGIFVVLGKLISQFLAHVRPDDLGLLQNYARKELSILAEQVETSHRLEDHLISRCREMVQLSTLLGWAPAPGAQVERSPVVASQRELPAINMQQENTSTQGSWPINFGPQPALSQLLHAIELGQSRSGTSNMNSPLPDGSMECGVGISVPDSNGSEMIVCNPFTYVGQPPEMIVCDPFTYDSPTNGTERWPPLTLQANAEKFPS